MSILAEFILVAIALFLWESTLWLPLRGIALRRHGSRGKWKILDPGGWFATRNSGLIPMRLLPPDAGLAPCQAPPLLVDDQGQALVEVGSTPRFLHKSLDWNDLRDILRQHAPIATAWNCDGLRCIHCRPKPDPLKKIF